MENIIKTAGILVFANDNVLLVRHGESAGHLNDTYDIPAGRLEPDESSTEAAIRELFEETGLQTTVNNLIKVPEKYTATIERKDGSIKNYNLDTFVCIDWSGELKANNETTPEWINIADLEKIKLLPNVKKMILDALKLKQNKT